MGQGMHSLSQHSTGAGKHGLWKQEGHHVLWWKGICEWKKLFSSIDLNIDHTPSTAIPVCSGNTLRVSPLLMEEANAHPVSICESINTQNIQKHLQSSSESELAQRKHHQLCSSAMSVPSPANTAVQCRIPGAGHSLPWGCTWVLWLCKHWQTKHQPGLLCTEREARITHAQIPLLPLRKVLINIARAHSKVILGTLPPLLASRPVRSQHPLSTRQSYPSGYWTRDKLNSLQPFHLPKPTVFTEQPKRNIA